MKAEAIHGMLSGMAITHRSSKKVTAPAIPGGDPGGVSPPETTLPCVSRDRLLFKTPDHSVTDPDTSRAEQLKFDKVKMKAADILLPIDTSKQEFRVWWPATFL